jgi:hypothetical protein
MKPRTLARIALKSISSGEFVFDTDDRKDEAIRQLKKIISGKADINNPEDPIIEIHIGVYVPNFDYPVVNIDKNDEPIVWKEDGKYAIPGDGSHIVKGIGISGDSYFLGYLDNLSSLREAIIKVDRYTDVKRAAYALCCSLTKIMNKKDFQTINSQPLKLNQEILLEEWNKHEDIKEYDKLQHKLYVKWLSKWINVHGRNPDTHMRVLKNPKIVNA